MTNITNRPPSNAHFTHPLPPACVGEQAAAAVLGYTQATWDDDSGQSRTPWPARKPWLAMSSTERSAAVLLGYTAATWDNVSGSEPQPAAADKTWAELTPCEDGENGKSLRGSTSTPLIHPYFCSYLSPNDWTFVVPVAVRMYFCVDIFATQKAPP